MESRSESGKVLYISKIASGVTFNNLREVCSQIGKIVAYTFSSRQKNCFIEFSSPGQVSDVLRYFDSFPKNDDGLFSVPLPSQKVYMFFSAEPSTHKSARAEVRLPVLLVTFNNVPETLTARMVYEIFSEVGEIVKIVVLDSKTGFRDNAFVQFLSTEDSIKAFEHFDNAFVWGSTLIFIRYSHYSDISINPHIDASLFYRNPRAKALQDKPAKDAFARAPDGPAQKTPQKAFLTNTRSTDPQHGWKKRRTAVVPRGDAGRVEPLSSARATYKECAKDGHFASLTKSNTYSFFELPSISEPHTPLYKNTQRMIRRSSSSDFTKFPIHQESFQRPDYMLFGRFHSEPTSPKPSTSFKSHSAMVSPRVRRPPLRGKTPSNGCVVLVSNLTAMKTTPQNIFNIFSQYGQVIAVKILKKKPDRALVQLINGEHARRCCQMLDGTPHFRQKLSVVISRHPAITGNPDNSTHMVFKDGKHSSQIAFNTNKPSTNLLGTVIRKFPPDSGSRETSDIRFILRVVNSTAEITPSNVVPSNRLTSYSYRDELPGEQRDAFPAFNRQSRKEPQFHPSPRPSGPFSLLLKGDKPARIPFQPPPDDQLLFMKQQPPLPPPRRAPPSSELRKHSYDSFSSFSNYFVYFPSIESAMMVLALSNNFEADEAALTLRFC
eukprot:gnl/Chilomastix_cuspidata/426.p1 GENE.gnl/Chilomastix_cuspidata/426~~gnl/Chilomastix_cuspidata/426.p1  ORF type:complete len:688 (-),score=103.27 gnl/Chilomastix_cuspidata/426:191-2176(-)